MIGDSSTQTKDTQMLDAKVRKVKVVRPCFLLGEARTVGDVVPLPMGDFYSAVCSGRCEPLGELNAGQGDQATSVQLH